VTAGLKGPVAVRAPDTGRRGEVLTDVPALPDAGRIRPTATETLGPVRAEKLRRARADPESGKAGGKLVPGGLTNTDGPQG